MGNRVVPLTGCFLDSRYRKTFDKLDAKRKKAREDELVGLVDALAACTHPTNDALLQRWRPSAYRAITAPAGGQYVEYRLKGVARVIACFFAEPPQGYAQPVVLLCAATLEHDHERMMAILENNREKIAASEGWEEVAEPDSGDYGEP